MNTIFFKLIPVHSVCIHSCNYRSSSAGTARSSVAPGGREMKIFNHRKLDVEVNPPGVRAGRRSVSNEVTKNQSSTMMDRDCRASPPPADSRRQQTATTRRKQGRQLHRRNDFCYRRNLTYCRSSSARKTRSSSSKKLERWTSTTARAMPPS